MATHFEGLVRQIADESNDSNKGLLISNETRLAYAALLALYQEIVKDVLKSLPFEECAVMDQRINYIKDATRTILMIRAINRAILKRQNGGIQQVSITEAGVGSGMLMAAALALNQYTQLQGYDYKEGSVVSTSSLLTQLGYMARTKIEKRDLVKNPPHTRPDVLIAEHIDQGLRCEQATVIPRSFDIDPNFVVPYAVIPAVYWPTNNITHRGEKVVLAKRDASRIFSVTGVIKLPPWSTHPIAVYSDVEWGSPAYGEYSLLQRVHNTLQLPGWENHLMQAKWLKRDEKCFGDVLAISNISDSTQKAAYSVIYPIGTFWRDTPIQPKVQVTGYTSVVKTISTEEAKREAQPSYITRLMRQIFL